MNFLSLFSFTFIAIALASLDKVFKLLQLQTENYFRSPLLRMECTKNYLYEIFLLSVLSAKWTRKNHRRIPKHMKLICRCEWKFRLVSPIFFFLSRSPTPASARMSLHEPCILCRNSLTQPARLQTDTHERVAEKKEG
jgi:hypothetical protein